MQLRDMGQAILGRRPGRLFAFLALLLMAASAARADSAAFDLSGPQMDIRVKRGNKTLPIGSVPNLVAGDRLWIHPDFPDSQSVHYVLIVAFLRGSTNPPPDAWFTRAETWVKPVSNEGIGVTVPQGAQQALLFLAPDTSGGFATLRSAVRDKPGAFVRALQDLNQAARDRSRLDKYLEEVREISRSDPAALHDRSVVLARTLNIKLEQQCFDKPTEQQAPCLLQGSEELVLDDPHSETLVASLTSGPSANLIGSLGSAPAGGSYGPYVGAVVDLARLLENMHTPEFQYIPALALPQSDELNLRLNNPPSFHKPKSVLVVGLPAVETAQIPPLEPVKKDQVFCLEQPGLALPVQGVPLAFSTQLAHDFVLHISGKSGSGASLPAKADAALGGFVINAAALKTAAPAAEFDGRLDGFWGFDAFHGPSFHLRVAQAGKWIIPAADQAALVAGHDGVVHLEAPCAVCVEQVTLKDAKGKALKAAWKLLKPEELEVRVPLQNEPAGALQATVKQFGLAAPDEVKLRSYLEPARLDHFAINAGEKQGVVEGLRLDEVEKIELGGARFAPAGLSHAAQKDELLVAAATGTSPALEPEEKVAAHVTLKDGRAFDFQTVVDRPRPKVTLLSKKVQAGAAPSAIHYGSPDALPQGGRITFLLKTEIPEKFSPGEKIEVATADNSYDVLLSTSAGTLMPQDSRSLLAVFEPLKDFGAAAFGPLRFRAVDASGGKGDWQALATLVRVPSLKEVLCPDSPEQLCRLSGTDLFLIDSVSGDAQFSHPLPVPLGFMESTLTVPRPNGTVLYIKLRDDPATVDTLILPVLPDEP